MKLAFLIPITAALCLTMAANAMADCYNADSDTYSCLELDFVNNSTHTSPLMLWIFGGASGEGFTASAGETIDHNITTGSALYGLHQYTFAIGEDNGINTYNGTDIPVSVWMDSEALDFKSMRASPVSIAKKTIEIDNTSYCVVQDFKKPVMTTTVTDGACR